MAGSNNNRRLNSASDFVPVEGTRHTGDSDVDTLLSSQPTSGYQSPWIGIPGQPSMADIVRSGRPQNKPPSLPVSTISASQALQSTNPTQLSHHGVKQSPMSAPVPSVPQHELSSPQDHTTESRSALNHESNVAITQHINDDGWPVVEHSSTNTPSSILDPPGASAVYSNRNAISNLQTEKVDMNSSSQQDELSISDQSVGIQPLPDDTSGTAPAADMHIVMENSGVPHESSRFKDAHYSAHVAYQSQGVTFENSGGVGDDSAHSTQDYLVSTSVEDVNAALSSNLTQLQQLSLGKDEVASSRLEDNMTVIMPNHLQDPSVDCSHLSFGSFGSGISAAFSASFGTKVSKANQEEVSLSAVSSSIGETDARNPEYSESDHRQTAELENLAPRSDSLETYDSASQQLEVVKDDKVEASQAHLYPYPTSVPNYGFENPEQDTVSSYPFRQTDQGLSPLTSVMQGYGSSSQSNFLTSAAQPGRETELVYSPFLATQSMPTKYSGTVSSISGPSISTPEVGKPNVFPTQSTAQSLPGGNLPTAPSLPQHVPLHAYSQPTALPLGHFNSMLSYTYGPPSFAYLPSAFQAYAGNSGYPTPTAAHGAGMKYSLPQYKNSISTMSNLTPSAAMAAGYGGFGSSASVPPSFALNPSTSAGGTPTVYDDILGSQFKDSSSHFVSVPQNEGSAMWLHAPGSRSISAVPTNTYYTLQGQQNQQSTFRQVQQVSHYTAPAPGYPNFYHSQSGVSQAGLEHQQAQADGSTTQVPASQQSHQIWAHTY
ncbi:uncharacterized protein LOC116264054 [Nymphaea colorata]|nr:uncharacterized protein LOC116264054 [Nymphaea colorata]